MTLAEMTRELEALLDVTPGFHALHLTLGYAMAALPPSGRGGELVEQIERALIDAGRRETVERGRARAEDMRLARIGFARLFAARRQGL